MAKKFKLIDLYVAKEPNKKMEWTKVCNCCGESHIQWYKNPDGAWEIGLKKPPRNSSGRFKLGDENYDNSSICSYVCAERTKNLFKNILKKVKPGESKKFRIYFEEIK